MTSLSAIFAFLVLILAAGTTQAVAEIIVDRCETDVEPGGQNLAAALARGGPIRFNCPGGTATIQMTQGYVLPPGVELDGGEEITLDGGGRQLLLFDVPHGDFMALGITIQNVRQQASLRRLAPPSVLYVRDGRAVLEDVSVDDSESPIEAEYATVVDSSFSGNAFTALDINVGGEVRNTTFRRNGTGLLTSGGTVQGCDFTSNTHAALRVIYPTAPLEIISNTFRRNAGDGAVVMSQRSAKISGSQTVRFRRNTFDRNQGTLAGGALSIIDTSIGATPTIEALLTDYPPTRFEFAYDKFVQNEGPKAGAIYADLSNTLGMQVVGGIFSQNIGTGGRGGAMSWNSSSVFVSHGIFVGNTANDGAAIWADSPDNTTRWQIVNSVFTRNVAGDGGGIVAVGPVELFNVTIARNEGIGFTGDVHGSPTDRPLIANSILSQNSQGNCRGIASVRLLGHNLQFGAEDCPGVLVEDPLLDEMLIPQLGASALTLGDTKICLEAPVSGKDLMFEPRASAGYCAVGAFEYPPLDRVGSILRGLQ